MKGHGNSILSDTVSNGKNRIVETYMGQPIETFKIKRRVVSQITEYLEPKEIFRLITQREYGYTEPYLRRCAARDRAIMSACFSSGGRISAVVGGHRLKWDKEKKRSLPTGEKHEGLTWQNVRFSKEGFIMIRAMTVVKRSPKVLQKYGAQAGIRDDFVIPLKRGLFENPYWDQLVPFGWLLTEFLHKYAQREGVGRLFDIETSRAWQIIRYITGMYPNWFRAMCEHFYGHYLLSDSVKLAKFMKVINVGSVAHYIGYSWKEQLKGTRSMDFDWIDRAVEKVKARIYV